MYAISEAAGRGVGVISMLQGRDWWTGRSWEPCSDRAKTFESREEAEAHAAEHCTRDYAIVDMDAD